MNETWEVNRKFFESIEKQSLASIVLKMAIFLTIILSAIFGNILVIISVIKYRRLRRSNTNIFIASLAVTDLFVAIVVMPFNMILSVLNRYWPFDGYLCDWYNSNDVLFSTASLLHLCCISVDRYIAVFSPLDYEFKMNRRKVVVMLVSCWLASFVISYIPIHTGIYAQIELKVYRENECEFRPNQVYGIISSTVSFWIPCLVMVIIYLQIYRQAKKQSLNIVASHQNAPNTEIKLVPPRTNEVSDTLKNILKRQSKRTRLKRNLSLEKDLHKTLKMRIRNEIFKTRENKAARTLGLLMGAFLLCWLPFFLWYLSVTICTKCEYPSVIVDILFWIGYLNSSLNPIIYAFFNKEFRRSFIRILKCNSKSFYEKNRSFRDSLV